MNYRVLVWSTKYDLSSVLARFYKPKIAARYQMKWREYSEGRHSSRNNDEKASDG